MGSGLCYGFETLRLDGWPGSARRRCFCCRCLAHARIEARSRGNVDADLLKAQGAARLVLPAGPEATP